MRSAKEKNNISTSSKSSERKNLAPRKYSVSAENHTLRNWFSSRSISLKQGLRANGLSLLPLALRPGLGCLVLTLVLGIVSSFSASFSDPASAASISLSIPGTLSLDINSTSPSGTFVKSEKASVTTQTDSATGYTLSIKAKDSADGNCLKNGDKKLESISSPIEEKEYETSGTINSWGYLPDKFNSLTNSKFLPAPTSSESVIDKTKLGNISPNSYGVILAAKVNNELPAGTYTNNYVLTAVANALTYSVTYDLQSGSGGPSPNPQTGTTDGSSFKLSSEVPTREGFEFKGWCTKQPAEDGSCSGAVVQPGGDFPIYCDSNDITLYAMWGEAPSMQDFDCAQLEFDQTALLFDIRDMNSYMVAKLKDGQCWMTQNLKIANKTLTSSDSDVASSFKLPASSTSGFGSLNVASVYVDGTYGGYYTWYAATAGEGTSSKSSGDVSHSICPKGWRLPTSNEYVALANAYGGNNATGSSALRSAPANFKLGGYYVDSSAGNQGSEGRYWPSTANDSDRAYNLYLNSSNFRLDDSGKRNGYSVRCVARQ